MPDGRSITRGVALLALGGAAAGCVEEPPPPPPPPPPPSANPGCYTSPGLVDYDIQIVGLQGTVGGIVRRDPNSSCQGTTYVNSAGTYVYAVDATAAQQACEAADPGTTTVRDLTTWGLASFYDCSPK